jgi:hypothetical protein
MMGMESPLNKGLGSTISHMENTRDVMNDDIVLEAPLLNCKSNCQVANNIGGVDEVTKDQTMAKTKSAFQCRMLNRIPKIRPLGMTELETGSKIHTKGQSRSKIQENSIRQGFKERMTGKIKIAREGNRENKDIRLSTAKGRFVHNHIRRNKGSQLDSFNKGVEGMNAGTAWTMRANWKSVSAPVKDMKEAKAKAGLATETECKMGSRARQYILPRMGSRLYNRIDGDSVGRSHR